MISFSCTWIFLVYANQCVVGMIEKRAGIYVNLGGTMVTGFVYYAKGVRFKSWVEVFFFYRLEIIGFFP